MRRLLTLTLLLLAACGPTPGVNTTPTAFPFPTMTPGRVLQVPMPTLAGGIPLDGSGRANPATAVAIANRPTATPNLRACPAPNAEAVLDPALAQKERAFYTNLVSKSMLEKDYGMYIQAGASFKF